MTEPDSVCSLEPVPWSADDHCQTVIAGTWEKL